MIAVIVQLIINGLMLGALYALAAVGLSLIFGIMDVVNLAHGSLLAMAAFVTYTLSGWFSGNIFAAATSAIFLVFLVGMIIERAGVYPFRASAVRLVVITISVGKILEQIIYIVWGPTYITSPIYVSGSLNFLGITISIYRVMLLALSVFLILALWFFIQKSKWGRAIRAVAQDEEASSIFGVNIKRVRTLTFALASALAAVAGIFLSSIYMFHSASGWEYLSIALSITIVGGLGDVRGAIMASFILGIVESYIGYYISPLWRTTVYFILIIIILTIKPSGLSGLWRGRT
jgi:branched-chain amino acid transport system permease protein